MTALTLALAACDDDEVAPPQQITVTVAPANVTMDIGDTRQLSAAVSGSTNQSVTWSSDDQSVATVNSSGLVTGVSEGQAAIRATSAADPNAVGFASVTVNPPPAITVTVTPSTGQVPVGGTIQLAATVAGTSNQNVTWSSQNQGVATVDQNGVVTGVSEGTAVIRATSAENASAFGSAAITVIPAIVGEIVIQRITAANTNTPVNPNNIAGQIDVTAEFTAPPGSGVTGVQVLVDDDVICSQSISGAELGDDAQAMASVVCPVITNAFDAATGTPDFMNGQHTIGARLTTATGEINASADQQVTFNNADTWVLELTTTKGPVFDGGGLAWTGGDVTVTGLPVLYSGNTIDRVSFNIAGRIRQDTDGSDGWSVTYANAPGGTNIAGVNTGANGVNPVVNASVYTNGQPGPNAVASWSINGAAGILLRHDNENPNAGTFAFTDQGNIGTAPGFVVCCSNNWVGASTAFSDFHSGFDDDPTAANPGVGGLTVTYFVGDASATNAAIIGGSPVETGADLAGTAVNTDLRAIAVVKDALDNQSIVLLATSALNAGAVAGGQGAGSATLGVDKIPPTAAVAQASIANMSVFNIANPVAGNFQVAFSDAGGADGGPSGFSANPALVMFTRAHAAGTACTLPSVVISNACRAQFTVGNTAHPAVPDNGQFTYEATVYDQAGNAAAPVTIITHADETAPVVNNVTIPSTLTGGQTAQFGVTATDELDLGRAEFRLVFSGAAAPNALPFVAPEDLGAAFDGTFTTSGTASASFPFVRSLEETPAAPAGAADQADGAQYTVFDAAGNSAANQTNFNTTGFTSATARNVVTFTNTADDDDICNGGAGECTDPDGNEDNTTVELTISATGPTGTFANPFQGGTVYVFRIDGTGVAHYVAAIPGANAQVTDTGVGNGRTWTWTYTFSAAGLAADAGNQLFAVGVDDEGDALRVTAAVPVAINQGS